MIRLTQYSHGAGCGCKISPKILKQILSSSSQKGNFPDLLIGNDENDDAAVYDIGNNQVVISTTDFFMPIVDDPFDFGGIAAVNAISDVYAMGGSPLLAISILGWPVDKISPDIARIVLDGARDACRRAGIPLAGGHSIDTPEPIFGLAVTGLSNKSNLRTNAGALKCCNLYLTKPLGVGIFTTAQKKGILKDDDFRTVRTSMLQLNDIGKDLGKLDCVKAITDVTGFGLLGHLIEMCQASHLSAEISFNSVPVIKGFETYLVQKSFPGGTFRNFSSYGHLVSTISEEQQAILCDPQTSGGLLIAVTEDDQEFKNLLNNKDMNLIPIGRMLEPSEYVVSVL